MTPKHLAQGLILVSLTWAATALAEAPAPPATAETVVEQQVQAYNRGDLQAFANLYAEDVEVFDLGPSSKPSLSGREALIAQYGPMFSTYKPQAQILSRLTQGAFVVDRERVTARGHAQEGIAIYQVENGRIRRVWFTP